LSEKEERDEEFKSLACNWSSNALTWAGFGLANFVLVVSIFTAFSVKINLLFEIATGLFLLSGVWFAVSWVIFELVASPYVLKRKNRKTGKITIGRRESYFKKGEYLALVGTLVWSVGVAFFLIFLEMYLALGILVIALVFAYAYAVPRYFLWRE